MVLFILNSGFVDNYFKIQSTKLIKRIKRVKLMSIVVKPATLADMVNESIRSGEADKRVKTGIDGLDNILIGGLPQKSITLVSGPAGTGKTTFGLQFLYKGAAVYNEPGVFVTLEDSPLEMILASRQFGWDIIKQMKEYKILFLDLSIRHSLKTEIGVDKILDFLKIAVEETQANRLVIDSSTILIDLFLDKPRRERQFRDFVHTLSKFGCSTILTGRVEEGTSRVSYYGFEDFAVSGVIALRYAIKMKENRGRTGTEPIGKVVKTIQVRKMRRTKHDDRLYEYDLTERGLEVNEDEPLLPNTKLDEEGVAAAIIEARGFRDKFMKKIQGE